jgi:hypothetical protein
MGDVQYERRDRAPPTRRGPRARHAASFSGRARHRPPSEVVTSVPSAPRPHVRAVDDAAELVWFAGPRRRHSWFATSVAATTSNTALPPPPASAPELLRLLALVVSLADTGP